MDNVKFEEIQAGGCQVTVIRQNNYQDHTLIFIHGNSQSAQSWEQQFSGTLYEHYNLLAFDLPGHGNSSKAMDPEQVYSMQGFRQVLLDVVRYYNLSKFVLVGHSLGGHIVLESLPYVAGCMAAVVTGAPPLDKPLDMQAIYLPNTYTGYLFAPEASPEDLKQLMNALMRKSNPDPPAFLLDDYEQTDPQVRVAVGMGAAHGLYDNEVEILAKTPVPVTIVHGEEEQLVNLDYLLQLPLRSGFHQVITIPEAGHMVAYENPVHFNRLLINLVLSKTV